MNNEENNDLKQNEGQNSEDVLNNDINNDINNDDNVNSDNNGVKEEFNPYISHKDENSKINPDEMPDMIPTKSVNITITRNDRLKFRKKLIIFILFMCILSFIRTYNDVNINPLNTTEPTTNVTVSNIAKPDESLKNWKLELSFVDTNLDFKNYSTDAYIPENHKIIEVTFDLNNISSRDQIIEEFECYSDNAKCELFNSVDNYITPIGQNVSPGRKLANAKLYFIVPEDAKTIEIEYESDSYRDEKFIFMAKGNKVDIPVGENVNEEIKS